MVGVAGPGTGQHHSAGPGSHRGSRQGVIGAGVHGHDVHPGVVEAGVGQGQAGWPDRRCQQVQPALAHLAERSAVERAERFGDDEGKLARALGALDRTGEDDEAAQVSGARVRSHRDRLTQVLRAVGVRQVGGLLRSGEDHRLG